MELNNLVLEEIENRKKDAPMIKMLDRYEKIMERVSKDIECYRKVVTENHKVGLSQSDKISFLADLEMISMACVFILERQTIAANTLGEIDQVKDQIKSIVTREFNGTK